MLVFGLLSPRIPYQISFIPPEYKDLRKWVALTHVVATKKEITIPAQNWKKERENNFSFSCTYNEWCSDFAKNNMHINPSTFLKDLVKHSLVALRIFEKDCLSTSWAVLSFPLDKGPGRKKTNINIRLQYDYLLTLIGAFTCKHVSLPTWKQCCQSTHNVWGSKDCVPKYYIIFGTTAFTSNILKIFPADSKSITLKFKVSITKSELDLSHVDLSNETFKKV